MNHGPKGTFDSPRMARGMPIWIGSCDYCGKSLYLGNADIVPILGERNKVVCRGACKSNAIAKWIDGKLKK